MIGYDRLKARVRPDLIELLRRAIQLDPADRYRDAMQMYADFNRLQSRARRQKSTRARPSHNNRSSWRKLRWREFQRQYRSQLDTSHKCRRCEGPVAESMQGCPWCGIDHPTQGAETRMPAHCPRCERGVKLDWNYCAWCYGPGFETETNRKYPDKRYIARCSNRRCRQPLMKFMRYCPWCRVKVRKPWRLAANKHKCVACGWGVVSEFWNYCAWCREPVRRG